MQPRSIACNGNAAYVQANLNGFQAYKNGLQGASATSIRVVRLTEVAMADNGGGPRTLTNYTGNRAGNVSGVFKLAGGHVEFGQVGVVRV